MSDVEDLAVELVTCTYCQATPGDRCVRRSWVTGRLTGLARYPHDDRLVPIIAGWRNGYDDAIADVRRTITELRRTTPSERTIAALAALERSLA